jgi:hypothetical protein
MSEYSVKNLYTSIYSNMQLTNKGQKMSEYDPNYVEGLALIRDGAQMIADGVNKILEAEEPEKAEKPNKDDFNALNWITKQGTKGDYQQAENDGSSAFKAVQQYVKAHKGFCHLHDFKIWLHNNDENLIDRKR